MENASECTDALRHNYKTDKLSVGTDALFREEKEINSRLKDSESFAQDLQQYTYLPAVSTTEDRGVSRGVADTRFPGKLSEFTPIQGRNREEHVVSSTTSDKKKRSSSPCDSTTDTDSTRQPIQELHHQRRHSRPTKITETAAATSTTSYGDDEERHQMQNSAAGRGRRGGPVNEVRPPSCGTPLGKIKEEQASSTTDGDPQLSDNGPERSRRYDNTRNHGTFLKPAAHKRDQRLVNPTSSASQPLQLGNAVNGEDSVDRRAAYPFPHHLPIDPQVRDGRYPFDPRNMSMHNGQGVGRSPILSDVSLIPLSPQPMSGVNNPFNRNSSLEFYMGGLASPTMSMLSQARNLSPRNSMQELEKMGYHLPNMTTAVGGVTQTPMTSQTPSFPAQGMNPYTYYQLIQQQRLLAMSLEKQDEMGRFHSPLCRSRARKRPLSISPCFSDPNFDITTMIRTSPNSLIPFVNGGLSNSRSSSVSGGSYGHLAAGGISPGYLSGMTSPQHLHMLSRQMSFTEPTIPGLPANPFPPPMDKMASFSSLSHPYQHVSGMSINYQPHVGVRAPGKNQLLGGSDNPPLHHEHKNFHKQQGEADSSSVNFNNNSNNNNAVISPASHIVNDENDILYETNCDWENCSAEFDTQEQLVQHINNIHIHGDKKEFVCRWRNCAREQRPFKAQYMLVVHMRRHTGEKPHKCTFKGCSKAYSRLENLKTHLRSHTGEKPYVCEFPSCTKAFSNASDRAKHQNRTHSNEKPYACKITGCTKRYTDPSSLRKHVKTVHGPEAHVTKRMKADKEREKKAEVSVKKEPGSDKEKRKSSDNDGSKQNCHSIPSYTTGPSSNDMNPPSNMNPRSNQSSSTSGSDMTPQNSPHMTSQNNDSGVDVNVGAHDGDSDGDIIVDENPLPDSTSAGAGVQSRRRTRIRTGLVPRLFSRKMKNLSLGGVLENTDLPFGDYPSINADETNGALIYDRKNGGSEIIEISSTNLKGKSQTKNNFFNAPVAVTRRQMAVMNQERRDSGTVSDVSRKSSTASQSSRRSSQFSTNGVNVAGSYDPISLDSSRRSSSVSNAPAPPPSGSDAKPLNPHQLHRLRSMFNQEAGLPPPTPISGETYSRSQMNRWLKEDENYRVPGNQGLGYQHANPQLQAQPHVGLPHPPTNENSRRRSDGPTYMRSNRTPLPSDINGQGFRRASDPARKTSQVDPNKLPLVQRYNSWNNITPLPGIPSRNQSQCSTSQYSSFNRSNMQPQQRTDSNGSFYSSDNGYQSNGSNMALHQQQHHQAHMSSHGYHTYGGVNEHLLIDNLNADMMSGSQPGMDAMVRNQQTYNQHAENMMTAAANVMSPATNVMSPAANAMSPATNLMSPVANVMSPTTNVMSPGANVMSSAANAMSPRAGNVVMTQQQLLTNGHYQAMNSPGAYHEHGMQSRQNHQHRVIPPHRVMTNPQQHINFDNGAIMQMSRNVMHGNPQMSNPVTSQHNMMMMQNTYGSNTGMSNQQMVGGGQYPSNNQEMYNGHNPNLLPNHPHHQMQRPGMQNQTPQHQVSQQGGTYTNHVVYNQAVPSNQLHAPRPPPENNSSNQNHIRLARLRHGNVTPATSQIHASASDTGTSHGPNGNRVNCTPDAQIPDEFLQQEFIDRIPELQSELFNNLNDNENHSYVKMAADSTTGPEGENGDDNDDAMSSTNTDVTLPPMSAFSSRLGTPVGMGKPYASQRHLAVNQHPAINMAINNMSSMLSTLEEENKYLNMMPPQ